jgi:hypothetical protein
MQSAAEASPETVEAEAPPSLRILICTPVASDDCKAGYAHSVTQAALFFQRAESDVEKYIDYQMVYGSNLVENRHILVWRAQKFEATHMLFWDSDIRAPADCIVRMVNHHLPIVAVNYPKKTIEAVPTAYIESDDYVGPCYTQKQHTGLQAVTSCGFGLMLIEMSVFDELKTPLFQFTQIGSEGIKTLTEDVYFCHKAIDAGFDVVIDHDLSKQISHIGHFEYTCEMADIAQAAKQQIYRGMATSDPDVPL